MSAAVPHVYRLAHLRIRPDEQIRRFVRVGDKSTARIELRKYAAELTSAWVDLTAGPLVVSTADTGGRFFMLPMLDMWTDVFAVPGKRTNGTCAANFALIPPGWTGQVPQGVEAIHSPTPHVWIIGRTQTNGVKDYDAVHKIQDGHKVTFLGDWGKTPRKVEQKIDKSVDLKTDPLKQVNEMPPVAYFKYAAELMKVNPPPCY